MKFKFSLIAATIMTATLYSAPAMAQDSEEASGPLTFENEVAVATDYRFRGISLSGKDPEVTVSITASHESGLYANAWATNVAIDGEANDAEVDLTAGYSKDIGSINIDFGGIYYLYPKNGEYNYYEFFGKASAPVGPATVTAGIAYAPSQSNIGDQSNTYYSLAGELPIGETPVTLRANFGIEDGAFGDKKKDWGVGVGYDLGKGFTASVDYIDTARAFSQLGDATVVTKVAFAF